MIDFFFKYQGKHKCCRNDIIKCCRNDINVAKVSFTHLKCFNTFHTVQHIIRKHQKKQVINNRTNNSYIFATYCHFGNDQFCRNGDLNILSLQRKQVFKRKLFFKVRMWRNTGISILLHCTQRINIKQFLSFRCRTDK